MPEDVAELVRAFYAAWARGDIQYMVDRCDPGVEIAQPPEVPDSKTYRGHEGVLESFEDWPKQWEEFRVELVDVIGVDEDRAISVNRQHLAARGIDFTQDFAFLHTFEDGMATRVDMFLSVEMALEASDAS